MHFDGAIGIDEAGRGPLAGPVCASAVFLNHEKIRPLYDGKLNDSKKLSEKSRDKLYDMLTTDHYCAWAVIDAPIIDDINIRQATKLAMARAIDYLYAQYGNILPKRIIIDGDFTPDIKRADIDMSAHIKGDGKFMEIAAASVIAKVTRDRIMIAKHDEYPHYGFAQHKGYGTKQHLHAIKEYGAIANLHRFSFAPLKNL